MPDLNRVFYRDGYDLIDREFSSEDKLLAFLIEQFKNKDAIIDLIAAYQDGIYSQRELLYRLEDHHIQVFS